MTPSSGPTDFAFRLVHLQRLGYSPTMLSTSLRRAVWAPMPLPGITRSSQNVQNVTNSLLGSTRPLHQRRYSSSSSKPPVPPSDGSRRLDTTPAKGVNSSAEKGKATRRRGKDGATRNASSKSNQQHAAFSNLPSVPSTQHRQPHGGLSNRDLILELFYSAEVTGLTFSVSL